MQKVFSYLKMQHLPTLVCLFEKLKIKQFSFI